MATRENEEIGGGATEYVNRITLTRAAVAGLLGGIAFGIPLQFVIGRMGAIGAMYNGGVPSLTIGWAAHIVHSILFGVIFGMATEFQPLHSWMERGIATAAVVGVGFGIALWSVNIAFIWPSWLQLVGFPPAENMSVPFVAMRPLLGHVLYGVIVGTVFHALVDY